jgi:hypothetical protein
MLSFSTNFRAAPAPADVLENLEHLKGLVGTWVGNGFSLISVPTRNSKLPFRLKLNATKEILTFTPIGAPIPNRGSKEDIYFLGLHYFQQVSDAVTNEALHLEPGIWLPIPETKAPKQGRTVVRLSTIPHGTSLLAQGAAPSSPKDGVPEIRAVDSIPFTLDPLNGDRQDVADPQYLRPFLQPLPCDIRGLIPAGSVVNPNLVLVTALERLKKQDLQISTVELNVSATPVGDIDSAHIKQESKSKAALESPDGASGGITNIPFLEANAEATSFAATFWIMTVKNEKENTEFVQLQYSQTAILDFGDLKWPHITVATLLRQ